MADARSRYYRFASYRLDTQLRELRDGAGAVVPLTAKAFDTLCLLVENRERVVGKDELLAAVWAGRVVEDNNLTQAIAALRRAFGTDGNDHRFIVTLPGRGYRFVADVETGAMPAMAVAQPTRHRAATAGALLFVLAVAAVVAWQLRVPSPATAGAPAAIALAVLPFTPLLPAPGDEGLLELGLADTLATRLGHAKTLRVRSVESARRVATASDTEAGRQLGATYLVRGSTQRNGGRVRVNVRLVSVATGATSWAQTFDAPADQVFVLQDQVAAAVGAALAVRPTPASAQSLAGCNGRDADAYRAWLRAQYKLHRRIPDTIAAFNAAIGADPACARAYAGLALAYLFMAHNDSDPGDVFPLAQAAARQALRIDPASAEAWMARGRTPHLVEWNWPAAEASLRRAIAINPSLSDAQFALAHLLVDTGRFDEGLAHARQARELDPLSPIINALEAGFLSAAGRPGAARARVQRALELDPEFWVALLVRGGLALDRGDTAAAIADLRRSAATSQRPSQVLAVLAEAEAAAGHRDQAQAILDELQARAARGYVPATSLAAVHNALGDRAGALGLLEQAVRQRDIRVVFLREDARWNDLRGEPRFRALADRLALYTPRATGRY
jgi:DNA-binding winged helix-turn-helix (wHTH) protein/TolB-like protein/Tfp pilus assembly protein PilF